MKLNSGEDEMEVSSDLRHYLQYTPDAHGTVKALGIEEYPGEMVIVRELVQNADDAFDKSKKVFPTYVKFIITEKELVVEHDGKPFSKPPEHLLKNDKLSAKQRQELESYDFYRISKIGLGKTDEEMAGIFGTGFHFKYNASKFWTTTDRTDFIKKEGLKNCWNEWQIDNIMELLLKVTAELTRHDKTPESIYYLLPQPNEYRDSYDDYLINRFKEKVIGRNARIFFTTRKQWVGPKATYTGDNRLEIILPNSVFHHFVGRRLKYSEGSDEEARFITNYLPFRINKSSKYAAGIERTYPSMF